MANRTTYHDHGLIFAKEWEDLQRQRYGLGDPLQMTNLGQREFARVIKAAGVRVITFHGLRHTCATLFSRRACRRRSCRNGSATKSHCDHDGHVRPRPTGDAAGRGGEAGGAVAWLIIRQDIQHEYQ